MGLNTKSLSLALLIFWSISVVTLNCVAAADDEIQLSIGNDLKHPFIDFLEQEQKAAYDCTGKPNGNYPDPVDPCSGYFYMCSNGVSSYFVCAQAGTVFSVPLDRCDYCKDVYPCNANPNNIRCPTFTPTAAPTTTTTPRPTCPPYDPNVYICICGVSSCSLQLITTTTTPRPTCPPYDPSVYICICGATSCSLQLITTTTTPRPTCPPFDPSIYICICTDTSCGLQLITTTTTPRPTCPPYDPSVYICVCGATSCSLQLITTTTTPRPTCPPFDPSVFICICGATSCQLELVTTTTTPRPTCPPYDPSVFICICGATSCSLQQITTTTTTTTTPPRPTCPPYDPNAFICICGATSCSLQQITTTTVSTQRTNPGATCGASPSMTTQAAINYDCRGKPNGNYPDPVDPCSGYFYMCSNQIAYHMMCALSGTVFDPAQDRCDYCQNVYPCNSGVSVTITASTTSLATTTPPRPSCPPYDPSVYTCVCGPTSCTLELIATTTTARPTCPPYDPSIYVCVCTGSSCILNLLPTTTTTTTTTTTARPTCPPHDSNIYNCVCSATSCQLELITTTIRPTTPFRCTSTGNFPYPGNCYLYYVCAGGGYIVAACPPGQVFNPNISFCENPGNVPGCSYFDIFIYKEALLLADVLTSEQSSFLLVQ